MKSNLISNLTNVAKKLIKKADKNSPALLTGMALVGLVGTAVASYSAGLKADKILEDYHKDLQYIKKGDKEAKKDTVKETVKKMVPVVLPAIIMEGITIACILGSNKVSSKRLAVLSAAYQLSENTVKDLNEKIVEVVGKKKAAAIKEKVSKKHMDEGTPLKESDVIITGDGDVLCYDSFNDRYFKSSAQRIQKAVLDASMMLLNEQSITVNDFYYCLGIKSTPQGDNVGWNLDDLSDNQIPIAIIAHLTENQEPCLAIEYDAHVIKDWYGDFKTY